MKKIRTLCMILMYIALASTLFLFVSCDKEQIPATAKDGFSLIESEVKNIEKISSENGIDTYQITFSDNSTKTIKITTNDSETVSVSGATIDNNGNLILIMSNGTMVNVGNVVGEKGDKGDTGANGIGISEVKINENGEMIIVYTDKTEENLGIVTGTDWKKIYDDFKISNPDYTKTQSEWIAEIVEKALKTPEYTVSFDTGDSGIIVPSQTVQKGDKASLPVIDTERLGYTFDGWYVGDEKWSFIGYSITEDITIEAKWSRVWSSNTLNVLCTRYGETASAPWGQFELNPAAYGEAFNTAYEARQAKIEELYGVTVNWVAAQDPQNITSDLTEAANADNVTYELAIPRAREVQSLSTLVFDMGNSKYIDFNRSYYSQVAYECMTVAGVTLFAAGDFSFQDEQVAQMIFFNKDLLESLGGADSAALYALVEEGGWTYDIMTSLARAISGDVNGNHQQDDDDKYGFATMTLTNFYQYFGVAEASVIDGMYQLTLNDPAVTDIVAKIIECNAGSTWCRVNWGGDWGANMGTAFLDSRVLFYNNVAQELDNWSDIEFELGVLPFPKLNSEQKNYCAPVNNAQPTFICIPKVTKDREMSEYFLDILMWMGEEYVMSTYYDNIELKLSSDYENDMRILKEQIHANIFYDVGMITSGWTGLLSTVRSNAHADNKDSFNALYLENEGTAQTIIDSWNSNWASYTDE